MKRHAGQSREEFEPVAARIRDRAWYLLKRIPADPPDVVAARRRALDLEKRDLMRDQRLYEIKAEAARQAERDGRA